MKELLRVGICIGFVLFEVVSSQAQNTSLTGGPGRNFEHHAEIVSVYDKAKDQTTVVMDWYHVYAGLHLKEFYSPEFDVRHNRLDIQAAFVYPGHVLSSTPEALWFGIRVGKEGGPLFKAKETPELTAVVDGETISLGKALLVKGKAWLDSETTTQLSVARLSARFTYQGLLRIVRAKKVAMKVGQLQFDLRESNLEALRDLASRMVPN